MKRSLLLFCFLLLIVNVSSARAAFFEDYPNNPVLNPDGQGFDSFRLGNPQIVQALGGYYLYYGGTSGGNTIQVGLATSSDGKHWSIISDEPVIKCAENTSESCYINGVWSSYRTVPEAVLYEDGIFKMWYLGNNQNSNPVNWLGYATSADGINWDTYTHNPIFPNTSEIRLNFFNVIKLNGQYLLYFINPVTNSGIRLATSGDGVDWEEYSYELSLPKDTLNVIKIGEKVLAISEKSFSVSDDGINFIEATTTVPIMEATHHSTFLEQDPNELWLWQSRLNGGGASAVSVYLATTSLSNFDLNTDDDKDVKELYKYLLELVDEIDSTPTQNSYLANLKKVLTFYEESQVDAALNQLGVFLKKLVVTEENGGVEPDVLDEMRDTTTEIIDTIEAEVGSSTFPLMTQISSPYPPESSSWATDAYAAGLSYYCGSTIAACGCAITSLAMLAQAHGITVGFDGRYINPRNLNNWLRANNGYTSNGNIIWHYALQYFSDTVGASHMSFDYHNATTAKQISQHLKKGQFAIGFKERLGHYFALTGLLPDNQYAIRDPWWYNTTNTDEAKDVANHVQSYGGSIDQANLFTFHNTPQDLPSWVEIHLGSPAELLVIDELGRKAGYDPVTGQVVLDIPGSSYSQAEGIASRENPEHFEKVLMIRSPQGQLFDVQVIGTGSGDYALTIATSGGKGQYEKNDIFGVTTPEQVDHYAVDVADTEGISTAATRLQELAEMKESTQPEVAERLRDIAERLIDKNVARVTGDVNWLMETIE